MSAQKCSRYGSAIAASLAVSGVVHAYLYIDGYRDIPNDRTGFPGQGSLFCALAVLILVGGPAWLSLVAARRRRGFAGRLRVVAHRRLVRLHRKRLGAFPIHLAHRLRGSPDNSARGRRPHPAETANIRGGPFLIGRSDAIDMYTGPPQSRPVYMPGRYNTALIP